MINPALDRLPGSAFVRLRALLDPPVPAVGNTLAMSIGEPQLSPPAWVAEIIAANAPPCGTAIPATTVRPPSALAAPGIDPFANVVVFHSLSKRSSAPGLRSGFVAGDAAILQLRSYAAVAMPLPIQAASAVLWGDDAHAGLNRAHCARLVAIAARVFADYPGYLRPHGGFFVAPGRRWRSDSGKKAASASFPDAI